MGKKSTRKGSNFDPVSFIHGLAENRNNFVIFPQKIIFDTSPLSYSHLFIQVGTTDQESKFTFILKNLLKNKQKPAL